MVWDLVNDHKVVQTGRLPYKVACMSLFATHRGESDRLI